MLARRPSGRRPAASARAPTAARTRGAPHSWRGASSGSWRALSEPCSVWVLPVPAPPTQMSAVHAAQRAANQRVDRRRVRRRLRRRRLEDAVDLQRSGATSRSRRALGRTAMPRSPRQTLAAARPDCLERWWRAQPHKAAHVARLGPRRARPRAAVQLKVRRVERVDKREARVLHHVRRRRRRLQRGVDELRRRLGGGTRGLPPRRRRGRARRAQTA